MKLSILLALTAFLVSHQSRATIVPSVMPKHAAAVDECFNSMNQFAQSKQKVKMIASIIESLKSNSKVDANRVQKAVQGCLNNDDFQTALTWTSLKSEGGSDTFFSMQELNNKLMNGMGGGNTGATGKHNQ